MRGTTRKGGDEMVVVEDDERWSESVVSGKQAATVAVSSEEDGGRGETGTEQQFRGKGQYYVIVISLSKASARGRWESLRDTRSRCVVFGAVWSMPPDDAEYGQKMYGGRGGRRILDWVRLSPSCKATSPQGGAASSSRSALICSGCHGVDVPTGNSS